MLSEVKTQIVTLMTAAFAFVAGLVWKDAIVEWFRPLTDSMENGAVGLTIVAVIVTIVVVILTMVVAKVFGKQE